MAKPQGHCTFCGGTGLTKQHIWPAWLKPLNPSSGPAHAHVTGNFETFVPIADAPPFAVKFRQGASGARKIRNVCRHCNNGWLSQVEEHAKPVILALMRGESVTLDGPAQARLAAWLALVTIMIEFTHPPTVAIPAEDRDRLMRDRKPGSKWRIWIARYGGTNWHDHACRHMGMRLATSPDQAVYSRQCNTQTTTLVIGQLCAHIYSSSAWIDFPGYEGPSGRFRATISSRPSYRRSRTERSWCWQNLSLPRSRTFPRRGLCRDRLCTRSVRVNRTML
jgi:hypothetical protein